MPLEIRELHIKAVVENPSEGSNAPQAESQNGGDSQEQIIKACVEKVMELIKDKKER